MWTNLDLEGHHGFPLVIGRGGRFSASSMVQHEKGPQKGLNFKERLCVWAVRLAGEPGFEPRQTESESVVLPLHHSPSKRLISQRFCGSLQSRQGVLHLAVLQNSALSDG